ncbi:hypothetical protein CYMTET_2693 [Cymbomonas tetramitiformis]|uniref:Uncharacterized protein n=1 Tax=Cymbomonas tetramitiformis TaxID=36881 RepID=A0AAE0EW97_9CHLO|nr:hypothetical protein CYMTET_47144 [Cymbomonas tetramitiformis]KAK3289898.1 hypothetical protein CYMTET_2693 [Cymbomonas tetramitiformis]
MIPVAKLEEYLAKYIKANLVQNITNNVYNNNFSGSNVDGDVNQHQHPTHRSDVVKRKREVALLRCDAEEKRLKLAMVKMDTAASPSGDQKQFQDWLEERYEPILLPPTERSDALRVSDIRIAFDEWVTDFDARFKNDRECEKALKLAKVNISPQARLYKNRNTRIRKLVFLKRRENCCAFGKAVDDACLKNIYRCYTVTRRDGAPV